MNFNEGQSRNNFFELFSLPEKFNLDVKALRARYRSLQEQFHPDKYSSAPEAEKLKAVQMSSLINDAYEVLSSPVKRATYILELSGINLNQDRHIDASILQEQITFREKLEDLKLNKGDEKEAALESFREQIARLFDSACQTFSKQDAQSSEDEQKKAKMKQSLSKMLFLNKLLSEIDLALEEFY